MYTTILLAAAVVVNGQVPSADESGRRGYARLPLCVISLKQFAELSAEESGILTVLTVEENDLVQEGQELGKIDDRDALAREKAAQNKLFAARKKATSRSELEVAQKIVQLAKAEYEESKAINQRVPGSIPDATVRRQFVQWEKAVLDEVVAQMNHAIAGYDEKVAEAELEGVQNEIRRRTLRAPFNGVIVKRYRQQSEWVQPGDPVLRVERMDTLRVEGLLSAYDYAPEEVDGAKVTITVALAGAQNETFESTISFVSSSVEASGDYRVWTEVANRPGRGGNRWLLRPGSEAVMEIQLKRAVR